MQLEPPAGLTDPDAELEPPGGRMSPIAPGIVPECSGASRVKRVARAGFAALDAPCALGAASRSLPASGRRWRGAYAMRVAAVATANHMGWRFGVTAVQGEPEGARKPGHASGGVA